MIYFHHVLWWYVSAIALVPSMAFTFYRMYEFYFDPPKEGWKNVRFREKYTSWWCAFDYFNWNFNKVITPNEKGDDK